MKSSNFAKLSGVVLIMTLVALGGIGSSTLAGPLPQATAGATLAVGTTSASAGGSAATTVATMSFPACPPAGGTAGGAAGNAAATMAATASAGGAAATTAATMAATLPANPGFIGIRVEAVDNCGVRVIEVLAGSPAVAAQIQVGDVVVAVNGSAVSGLESMRGAVGFLSAGDKVTLTVQRAGQEMSISITLAQRPAELPATVPASAGGAAATAAAATTAPLAATMAATQ